MFYYPTPVMFHIPTEKEKRDYEILDAIYTTLKVCGYSGEDISIMSEEVLKQMGRKDLLSPCERD